ncbi:MAG: fimbria/pilus outer membrane usher protein [Steroidobacteraceae bacterium]|nr:fimbria/pilus outer membrane usher protein [Steroidobacteraceae bacterium]
MKRCGAVGSLLLCLLALSATSGGAQTLAVTRPAARETMVVRVTLNTESKGDVFVERTPDGDFLVKIQDLRAIGFREPTGSHVSIEGDSYLSLRALRGVKYEFDETRLALSVTAEAHLLARQTLAMENQRANSNVVVPTDNSLFVNYALNGRNVGGSLSRPSFAGELGWRWGNYLFLTEGSTVVDSLGARRRFVRLLTSITHDDRQSLRRTVAGDFFTTTREFSNGVNLGGLSISKLYGLNPDFIRYPMQTVTGNVSLPSDLEVYVDGQRIRTERLKPGEFELRDILAYGGARNVQVVLRDAFGRVQQYAYSFYFSDQPLRKGLHEYSYNAGALRRGYGDESALYGPGAFSMFHRYGVTDGLTIGLRAEGTRHLLNGGPIATVVLGSAGVASLAAAVSSIAGQRGTAALASYSYQTRVWSTGFGLRHDGKRFASLGDPIAISNRRYEGSFSVSRRLGTRGSVSLSHSMFVGRGGYLASRPSLQQPYAVTVLDDRRVSTLSYSTPLIPGRLALNASLSHTKDSTRGSRNELYLNLTMFMGGPYTGAASYRRDRDTDMQSLQVVKQQPPGEGLGYVLGSDRWADGSGSTVRAKGTVQYNAPAAILRADLSRERDQTGQVRDQYGLSAAGGIAFVGGNLAFGRPITGSFGIVQVHNLAGVGVLVNGQRVGDTDATGRLFVPSMNAYMENEISVAAETVPIEYSLASISRRISPALRGGTLVQFSATRLRAFSGKLQTEAAGGSAPLDFVEGRVKVNDQFLPLQTGRGGEFYFENLDPGSYPAMVVVGGKQCSFELVIPATEETFVDLGPVVCRIGQ